MVVNFRARIIESNKHGRGYKASETICKGNLIFQEETDLHVPYDTKYNFGNSDIQKSFCKQCLKIEELNFRYDCDQKSCSEIMFCSQICKKRFSKHHELYCIDRLCSVSNELKLAGLIVLNNSIPFPETESADLKETLLEKLGDSEENVRLLSDRIRTVFLDQKRLIDKPDFREDPKKIFDSVLQALKFVFLNGFAQNLLILDEAFYALSIYRNASRFNHSCEPNCHYVFVGTKIRVYASTTIPKGEELTVSYSPNIEFHAFDTRRDFLHSNLGFFCECDRCLRESETETSELEIEESLPPENIQIMIEGAKNLYEEGEIEASMDQYFEVFKSEVLPKQNALETLPAHYYEVIDCVINLAVYTKRYNDGLLATRVATEFAKKKRRRVFECSLLGPKLTFLEVFFLVCGIKTEDEYLDSEPLLFDRARRASECWEGLFKDGAAVLDPMKDVHFGFPSALKIIRNVAGYFDE